MSELPCETAFVSTIERQNSTLGAIRNGQNPNSHFSCLKRALTELDIAQQQQIRLCGRKMQAAPRGHDQGLYSELWHDYGSEPRYVNEIPDLEQGLSTGGSSDTERVSVRMEQYLDRCLYDAFDRSNTLPCIKVKKAKMKSRKPLPLAGQTKQVISGRNAARQSVAQPPEYTLGVANSIDYMSQQGKPTGLEHQLALELKHNITHLKRTSHGLTRTLGVRYDFGCPTVGEKIICKAIRANQQHNPKTRKVAPPNALSRSNTMPAFTRSEPQDSGFISAPGEPTANWTRTPISRRDRQSNSTNMLQDSDLRVRAVGKHVVEKGEYTESSEVAPDLPTTQPLPSSRSAEDNPPRESASQLLIAESTPETCEQEQEPDIPGPDYEKQSLEASAASASSSIVTEDSVSIGSLGDQHAAERTTSRDQRFCGSGD